MKQDEKLNHITHVWQFISDESKYHLISLGGAATLDEASQKLISGVYTTFRTYQHDKVLRLEDHFDRLEQSAKLLMKQMVLPRYALRGGIREILSLYPDTDVRLRIHCAFESNAISVYLLAESFIPIPESYYQTGVSVKTILLHRENPRSKSTKFIELTKEVRQNKPKDIHEYLMINNEATLLEGLSSNVFVLRDGVIWTASQGILPGITRQTVLEVIAAAGMKIEYSGYPVDDIFHAEEMFITSASRGVLPVTRINNQQIGSGKPGKLTLKIKSDYEKWLQSELRSV